MLCLRRQKSIGLIGNEPLAFLPSSGDFFGGKYMSSAVLPGFQNSLAILEAVISKNHKFVVAYPIDEVDEQTDTV